MVGVVVSDITMETTIAVAKVTANSRKSRPTMPAIRRMGMKTATSETLIEKTVNPISLAPLRAASMGDIPCSRNRVMFSITTMASSMTKPVEMVSAMSDRLSRLKPTRYMTAKVPINETGTATLGIMVARGLRKKKKTTSTTRPMEMSRVRSTSSTEARMVVVRSRTIVALMPCGRMASRNGN